MNAKYPARFQDANGNEATILHNDGTTLWMQVRGVRFSGTTFDDFEPDEETDPANLASFRQNRNELCDYTLECRMPMPLVADGQQAEALLHVRITLGVPDERGVPDWEEVLLTLRYAGNEYSGNGRSGLFEDELLEIQRALPEGVFLKACITCAFSDYHPAGQSTFGSMACFRDNKAEYLQVNSKDDLFRIWNTQTEYVQETYLCPEFQRRRPGAGYRG